MSDIRQFLCKRKKIENEQFNAKDCPSTSAQQSTSITELTTQQTSVNISDEIRFKVLETPWKPPQDYDFKQDIDHKNQTQQRAFRTAYPWLAYSAQAKAPLCRTCVLLPAQIHRSNTQGPFIIRPCKKYKKFHAKNIKTSTHYIFGLILCYA